jgi:predicted enzyme related to lactoylglutathione lyase
MKIILNSVFVNDQAQALKFYTEVLDFVKKADIPAIKWLTVVSPEEPNGTQLLLEPNENPSAPEVTQALKTYREALFNAGIPATAFGVADIQKEYTRMKRLGVKFTMEPTQMGPATLAVFDDTCGNLIQIAQR